MLLNLEVFGQNGESYEEIFQILCLIKQNILSQKGEFLHFFLHRESYCLLVVKTCMMNFCPWVWIYTSDAIPMSHNIIQSHNQLSKLSDLLFII